MNWYIGDATVSMLVGPDHEAHSNDIDVSRLTKLCHIYIIVVCPDLNLWLR